MVYTVNLDNSPPYYRNAYSRLKSSIATAENAKEKLKVYRDFSSKFTMIPNLWIEYLKILQETNELTSDHLLQALKHFYSLEYSKAKFKVRGAFHRCFFFQDFDQRLVNREIEDFEKYLTYPNNSLETLLRKHAEYYGNPPSKALFERHKSAKIVARNYVEAYDILHKWFKIVIKTNNDLFIFQNIESRISEDPFNEMLWKLFIEYLDGRNHIWLLNVYSRYCRLFLEDHNIRQKYYQTIENFASQGNCVSKWYLDAIMFEQNFKNGGKTAELLQKVAEKTIISNLKAELENLRVHCEYITDKCDKLFKQMFFEKRKTLIPPRNKASRARVTMAYSNSYCLYPYAQNFSLPPVIINKLAHSGNFHLATKLRFCCKHFMRPLKTLCYRLRIKQDKNHFKATGFNLEISEDLLKHFENVCVEKVFILDQSFTLGGDVEFPSMAKKLPKFYNFNPEVITCHSDVISWELIKFFGTVQNLKKLDVQKIVTETNNLRVPLEDIIETLPNVVELSFKDPSLNSETFYKLSMMKRKVKFQYLQIAGYYRYDPIHFCDFLKINGEPRADIRVAFSNFTPADGELFKTALNNFVESLPKVAGQSHFNITVIYQVPF